MDEGVESIASLIIKEGRSLVIRTARGTERNCEDVGRRPEGLRLGKQPMGGRIAASSV
jgi:hypothetical protein